MRAKDVMRKDVILAKKSDSLESIIKALMHNHISGMPVVDADNHLLGVVSEQDIVVKRRGLNISSYMEYMTSILFIDGNKPNDLIMQKITSVTAEDVMTTPAFAVHPDATVTDVVLLMMNRQINRIPVVDDDNKLLGIIGRNDLLPLLL